MANFDYIDNVDLEIHLFSILIAAWLTSPCLYSIDNNYITPFSNNKNQNILLLLETLDDE